MDETTYYDPVCQDCGESCSIWEIVNDGFKEEIWCYCPECDTETFHPKPDD